ncbi:hypothetical protein M1I50_08900 [Clostridioides difficile]|uniref:hypothetical protein n=1 Tax=Clostridioides difficile TaxID=1496 RepID=UPI000D1F3CA7|nr:hypothetical protein [Clostridioides difficile]KAK2245367.1 hypothetical protein XC29_00600 [Clostridioides difficile]MBY1968805.1 hypothetical protein [Clostridioides difficile]MBY2508816.1 hypothetical protein [Clostridioides difficile]MBZ4494476.1 hypothetical protein [Clostridioides difficile]MCL0943099.1 hypothetical protein [Clostridioides difficile]
MGYKTELTEIDIKNTIIALNTIKYICTKSKNCKNCPLGYMKNLDEHNCMLYELIDKGLLPCDWSVKKVTRLLDTTEE